MAKLEKINCPFCAFPGHKIKYIAEDYLYSQELFKIVKCDSCGLLYTNPRISENDISRYYSNNYFTMRKQERKGLFEEIKKIFHFIYDDYPYKLLRNLRRMKAKKILEIGPGSGENLFYLKKNGFDVVGVEISEECVNHIRERGIECHLGDLEKAYEKLQFQNFDAVVFFHVFEHIYEPVQILNLVHKLLNDKGKVFIILPNSGSLEARIFGKYWLGFDVPRHVVHYDKKTIIKMLEKAGFKAETFVPVSFPPSFVRSLEFAIFKGLKMPRSMYLVIYCFWKILQPVALFLIGSGVMEITAVKKQ